MLIIQFQKHVVDVNLKILMLMQKFKNMLMEI